MKSRRSAETGSSSLYFWAALFCLSMLGGECSPSSAEAAGAVLAASPIAYIGGLIAVLLLRWIWQPLSGPLPIREKALFFAFFLLLGLAGLGNLAQPKGVSEWLGIAVIAFGPSYISLLLVVWRIWIWKKPETACTWAPLSVMAVMLLPAPYLLTDPPKEMGEPFISFLWLMPGMFGYVSGPLFVALVGEVFVRRLIQSTKTPPDKIDVA